MGPARRRAGSVVGAGARVGRARCCENAILGEGAEVGAGARLGPGAVVGDGAVIAAGATIGADDPVPTGATAGSERSWSDSLPRVYPLDGPEALSADSLGLIRGIAGSVAALDEARAAAEAVEIPYPAEEVTSVAVCGMGGSAIAADLVLGAYRERMRVPVHGRPRLLPAGLDRRAARS